MPRLSSLLLDLCRQNPHGKGDEGFVFYSTLPDRPMDNKVLLRGLRQALVRLSVGEEATEAECEAARAEWKARKIVFHSWRHLYASRMADEVASRVLMQATGHKTAAVFDVYASHRTEDDFQAVGNSLKKVFSFVDKVLEDLDVAGEDRSAM
jgi:integrase